METKTCSKCEEDKPVSEFHKKASTRDGYNYQCKPCRNSQRMAYHRKNRDEILARNKVNYEANKVDVLEANRGWRSKNKDLVEAGNRRRYEANKPKYIASNVKRRAAQLQRTPQWADMSAIAEFYVEAKRLEELTGIQFHVDHIVPLQGELVSGLHVPANLQLLPAHENLSKSNSFEVAA